jgi:hypothetical protein
VLGSSVSGSSRILPEGVAIRLSVALLFGEMSGAQSQAIPTRGSTLLAAAAGAGAFLLAQGFLLVQFAWRYRFERIANFLTPLAPRHGSRIPSAWWLKTAPGEVLVITALFLVAMLLVPNGPRARSHTLAMTAGAVAAMIGLLFFLGPGSLWPLAIVVGGAEIGLAILAGAAAGQAARSVVVRRPNRA